MGKKKQGDIPEAADEKKVGRCVRSGRAAGNPAMRTWLTGQGRTRKWEGKCGQSEELQESGKLNLDNQSRCRIDPHCGLSSKAFTYLQLISSFLGGSQGREMK